MSVPRGTQRVLERCTYTDEWLVPSYAWLHDPVIAEMVGASPFTLEEQRAWFANLTGRTDYRIWGIRLNGVPVGAMGLKTIGRDDGAEYFLYIGEQSAWGQGISKWAFREVVNEAREMGLRCLYGRVVKSNERSLAADLALGFTVTRDLGDAWWVHFDL